MSLARGSRRCLDDLIAFLGRLDIADQIRLGLGWVRDLCVDDRRVLVRHSASLSGWLIGMQPHLDSLRRGQWQDLVDTLVAARNTPLAPYSA